MSAYDPEQTLDICPIFLDRPDLHGRHRALRSEPL